MKYKEFIELGFERTDFNDNVEFDRKGYGGYSLGKKLGKKMLIEIYWLDLDKPKLYIRKPEKDQYHIIPITIECMIDLINNFKKK